MASLIDGSRDALLVVDPFISPDYLCHRVREMGCKLLVLSTMPEVPAYFDYSTISSQVIQSSGNPGQDVEEITKLGYNLIAGFYGVETAVPYADQVFARLFPNAHNDITTSELRCSKFEMMEAVKNTTYYVDQINIFEKINENNADKIECFLKKHKHCIIKPSFGSAASYGVESIHNLSECKAYFKKDNFLLSKSNCFVLQEKVDIKQEFYVDCASYKGKHTVVGIGVYAKSGLQYQYIEHLAGDFNRSPLEKIAMCLLDKLGMKNGFSHLEIAYTATEEYKLIELNPRVSGAHGILNHMASKALGVDQVGAYFALIQDKPIQNQHSDLFQRTLILNSNHNAINIQNIHTALHSDLHYKGLKSTNDLENENSFASSKGFLLLSSLSEAHIHADTHAVLNQ